MKIAYLAAPLSPIPGETRAGNIERAKRIYRELSRRHQDTAFLAPWILNCEVFAETDENRQLGMRRNFAAMSVCSEFWLAGPRLSTGMADERIYADKLGLVIVDMIGPSWEAIAA